MQLFMNKNSPFHIGSYEWEHLLCYKHDFKVFPNYFTCTLPHFAVSTMKHDVLFKCTASNYIILKRSDGEGKSELIIYKV